MFKELVECVVMAMVVMGWFLVTVFGWQLGTLLTVAIGFFTWALTPVAKALGINKLFEE